MGRRTLGLCCCAFVLACGPRVGSGAGAIEGQGAGTQADADGVGATAPGSEAVEPGAGSVASAADDAGSGEPCRPIPAPPPAATTDVNWDHDDSSECPDGQGAAHVVLPDRALRDLDLCAAVAEIRPPADPAGIGLEPYATVVLAGSVPEDARSFLILVPPETRLPFAVGDVLSARIHVATIRIHQVVHATIADASGRLLVALSGGGSIDWAPAWRIRQLEVAERQAASDPGGAERREHVVGLSHDGRVARVPPSKCRLLETTDGAWLVAASAVSYGEGTRLPDSAEYSQYQILRRAAP